MRVTAVVPTEQVMDVRCDVCGASTRSVIGELEYGVLQAHWGYGSPRHDGDCYEVHLCEGCFFNTLAFLRQEHRSSNMFDEDYKPADPDTFGQVGLRER